MCLAMFCCFENTHLCSSPVATPKMPRLPDRDLPQGGDDRKLMTLNPTQLRARPSCTRAPADRGRGRAPEVTVLRPASAPVRARSVSHAVPRRACEGANSCGYRDLYFLDFQDAVVVATDFARQPIFFTFGVVFLIEKLLNRQVEDCAAEFELCFSLWRSRNLDEHVIGAVAYTKNAPIDVRQRQAFHRTVDHIEIDLDTGEDDFRSFLDCFVFHGFL